MDETQVISGSRVEELVPAHCHRIREVLQDENFGGRTLLFYLLGKVVTGELSITEIGLGAGSFTDQSRFLLKLEVITALTVVISARGGTYSLDEQVEDFLMFPRAEDVCRFQNMEKFHRAALPAILWAITEDDKLREHGEIPERFRMPLDILVAIGAEVAEWHMAMTEEGGLPGKPLSEDIILETMASTVRDTYRMISEKLNYMGLHWAVDEIRARYGVATVSVAVE